MDLVDRYLKAVENALPEAQRQDILSELSEDIHSEMEDKQSELGRALTEEEQQALLKQRGNPLLLAARYRQDHRSLAIGRQLIGAWFPRLSVGRRGSAKKWLATAARKLPHGSSACSAG